MQWLLAVAAPVRAWFQPPAPREVLLLVPRRVGSARSRRPWKLALHEPSGRVSVMFARRFRTSAEAEAEAERVKKAEWRVN